MTTPRVIPPLDQLEDGELAALAVTWRAKASRGDRKAYGIAHALEVEQRRRQPKLSTASPAQTAPRPWWKFWRDSSSTNHPGEPTS